MDLIAARSTAERIEILTLIKQQLSAKLRLAAVLKRGSDVKTERSLQSTPHNDLREAIEQACSNANTSLSDKTDLRLGAVCLEIKKLEEKQREIIEVGKRCESLVDAIKKVQEYVAGELSVDSSEKRDRTAADLDDLSKEASAAVEACKKVKVEDIGIGNSGANASKPGFRFFKPASSNPLTTPSSTYSSTPPPAYFSTPSSNPFPNFFTTTASTAAPSLFAPAATAASTASSTTPFTAPSSGVFSGFGLGKGPSSQI